MNRFILSLAMALVLAGCSSRPSDGDVESAVRTALSTGNNAQMLDVGSVDRKNGFADQGGVYVVEVEYTLSFKKSYKEIESLLEQEMRGKGEFERAAAMMQLQQLRLEHGDFQKGQKIVVKDKIPFVKAEKGWQVKA
jgi:hypothetical protein